MKNVLFFATVVALSLTICVPVQAQSRKDKKAAEKEQWELEQQMQREEAELRHKMRMDSLRKAQQKEEEIEAEAKEARLRAEEERRAAEAAARERLKKEEEAAAMQEVDFDEPCMDAKSTETYLRARGVGESLQQQSARTKAQTYALRDLASKVGVAVKSVLKLYTNDETIDVMTDENSASGMSFEEKTENMIKQVVDQNLTFSTPCEQTKTYMKNNRKVYKCYMVVQAGKDDLLKPLYEQIQNERSLKLKSDYENFKEEFEKEFEKQE